MLNSFIIVFREGFESILLVAVILSYLRKSGQSSLHPLFASRWFWVLSAARKPLRVRTALMMTRSWKGCLVRQLWAPLSRSAFLGNESLREGVLESWRW